MQNDGKNTKVAFGANGPNSPGEHPKMLIDRTAAGKVMLVGKYSKSAIEFVMTCMVLHAVSSIFMFAIGQWPLPSGYGLIGLTIGLSWLGFCSLRLLLAWQEEVNASAAASLA